jgi:23S rRNA pseudouridine1911/1915/1917 synthase
VNTSPVTENEENFQISVSSADREEYKRLDVYLVSKLPQFSRSTIKRLFEDDQISVGTLIEVEVPPPVPTDLIPENIPLEVLFEDEHLILIDKPAGLVVHPAPGHYTGTLVNAILHHCPDLKGIGSVKRPGIVHRLDMGTSGVMVVAKDQATHEGLVQLFSTHDIERRYEALVVGTPSQISGTLTSTIGRHPTNRLKMQANVPNGKKAITHFKVLKSYSHASHMELKLETGRTHQIRVHLSQLLHSAILCDPVYGSGNNLKKLPESIRKELENYPYQLLHAKELGFIHPITKKHIHFTSSPPGIFQSAIRSFQSEN